MIKLFLIISLLLTTKNIYAGDTASTLSLEDFFNIVKKYHPVAKQADIQVKKAAAELLISRAAFDPVANVYSNNKTFDGINYYQNTVTQLNIPTWYGIEVQAGTEYLNGTRFDPQETLGKTSFAGISIPLAKNLIIDKRRAALQQAQVMQKASAQQRRMMLNDLLMDAAATYWDWVLAHNIYETYSEVITINKKRLGLVISAYNNGESPAIDTIEAAAQLQQFEYRQNEALLDIQNAGVALSAFLWTENNQWYNLPEAVKPKKKLEELYDAVIFPELNALLDAAKKNHPALNIYNYKLNVLGIEKKLKFQELLPNLDLKYTQLGKGYNIASTTTKSLFDNNYRFGINLAVPLRLSQGRGEYKLAKLKITETKLEQTQKEVEVLNKVRMYYNQLVNYKTQVTLLQKNYASYQRLQKGEELKFFNGESNLFLVNSRENKTLETLLKLTETTIKYNKTAQALQWAAGQLQL